MCIILEMSLEKTETSLSFEVLKKVYGSFQKMFSFIVKKKKSCDMYFIQILNKNLR